MKMRKLTEKQYDKLANETLKNLQRLVREGYGPECPDHVEECVVCSAYLLLKEYKRLFIN